MQETANFLVPTYIHLILICVEMLQTKCNALLWSTRFNCSAPFSILDEGATIEQCLRYWETTVS